MMKLERMDSRGMTDRQENSLNHYERGMYERPERGRVMGRGKEEEEERGEGKERAKGERGGRGGRWKQDEHGGNEGEF
jgi:hypothetical protein